MDDYADCLAGFLVALRVEPAHLVGLSFGAALLLATVHRYPGIALSLALVSGYAGWVGSLGPQEAQKRLSRSLQLSQLPGEEFVAAMVPSMFSPSVTPDVVAGFVDRVRGFRRAGFQAMARASYEDQSQVLPQVDVPVLLLYSDDDVRAPVAVGEAMHAVLRESELVVLQGPGHVSSVEAPDQVTAELRRFLRSIG